SGHTIATTVCRRWSCATGSSDCGWGGGGGKQGPSLGPPHLSSILRKRLTSVSHGSEQSPTPLRPIFLWNEVRPRKLSGSWRNYSSGIDARIRLIGGNTSASTS